MSVPHITKRIFLHQPSKLLQTFKIFNVGSMIAVQKRTLKTTIDIHPKPVFEQDEKILEKVLKEREHNDDLPIEITNPYNKPPKECILCANKLTPNYKNVKLLYQFVSPYTGMMYGRHITGLCKRMHLRVEKEIKTAVNFGLMSNYIKEVEFLKDPKLFNPEKPATFTFSRTKGLWLVPIGRSFRGAVIDVGNMGKFTRMVAKKL